MFIISFVSNKENENTVSKQFKHQPKATTVISLGVTVVVAVVGYLVFVSLAAGAVVKVEAESANPVLPALSVDDPAASGTKAIMFKDGVPGGGTGGTTGGTGGTGSTTLIAAAGDIAMNMGEKATSDLVLSDNNINTVLALGDLAYDSGTASEFSTKYDPTWGRFKAKTKPTPGNHEYYTKDAAPYYAYWNNIPEYYSFDIGGWHMLSLNSQVDHGSGSAQLTWLKSDLAAHQSQCTLAFWHQPRFSAGSHSDDDSTQPFWDTLYDAGADVVLAGHSHNYERFAPSKGDGSEDQTRGIQSFVVGTGGGKLDTGGQTKAKRLFDDASHFGVLKLTLGAGNYSWVFATTDGQKLDTGTGTCH